MNPNPARVLWVSVHGAPQSEEFEHVVVKDSGVLEAYEFDEDAGHPMGEELTLGRNVTYEVDWL